MDSARVLVVDDSPTIRKLVELALRGTEWSVAFAASGTEAVAAATATPPDAILLDFVLPDMRGVDVCARLSREATTADVPIFLMTAKEGREVQTLFEPYASVIGWLRKPFSTQQLLERLSGIQPNPNRRDALFTLAQREQAARAVFAHLKDAFGQIPAWLATMGAQPPATFFARRILTPERIGRLLDALEPIYRDAIASRGADAPSATANSEDIEGSMLRGEAKSWPLQELLGLFASTGRTGELTVSYGERSALLYLRRGEVVLVTNKNPNEYLHGLRIGQPSQDAFERAREAQQRTGKPVPVTLAELGHKLPDGLTEMLHRQGRRILLDVLDARAITFVWRDLAAPPLYVDAHGRHVTTARATLVLGLATSPSSPSVPPASAPPESLEQLTLERLRRETSSNRSSDDTVFDRVRGFSKRVRLFDLTAAERRILALVDGRHAVRDVAARSAVPLDEASSILHRLQEVALLAIVPPEEVLEQRSRPVLILEPDVEGFQKPLESLLRNRPEPVSLLSLAAGSDVVAAIRRERPRMVIVNASVVAEVYTDTARAVRTADDLADVALVAVLESPMASHAAELSSAGFDAVLVKPVAYTEIERLIDS